MGCVFCTLFEERGTLASFPPSVGKRCPEGAEVGSRSGVKGDVWEAVFSFH